MDLMAMDLAALSDGSEGNVIRAVTTDMDDSSRSAKARASVNYWLAGVQQAQLHDAMPWSVTCDATRVGKRNIFGAAIVFPSNVGFWLPPKDPTSMLSNLIPKGCENSAVTMFLFYLHNIRVVLTK
jgi:hypothetical protein